ncbi:type II toxin-antitoxin system PemK/MazF family toxin [Arvimicrobium flavum]|uniref:type II toxin-antitoxin system PemK/MazF family toxin n=1 Tax=Arvimicrobium flavum TaxID=3393320 RepID=UPI00237BEB1A|nr:type II toxin-antitoxin system PemK/MazF family toxin [Mesorhizobium shangrilense]
MKRGDIVLVSLPGDYGKTRPAVVIQNDDVADILRSCTILLMTSELVSGSLYRLTVEPSAENGLDRTTQVQVDKIASPPKEKLRGPIGKLTVDQVRDIDLALLRHLDIRGHGIE